MADNESLLSKNVIRFESNLNIEKRSNLSYELKTVAKQQPNTRFLKQFEFRLWLHNRISQQDSVKKFKRWLLRKVGEPAVIYSPKSTEQSAESMQFYLNNKGYFNAKVEYKEQSKKKRTSVYYTVTPNRLLKIKKIENEIQDEKIREILEVNKRNSFLKEGSPVNNKLFDQEKNRISTLLRNHGYAYFYPNYVKFLSYDSTNYQAEVATTILPAETGNEHQTYTIGNVYINPSFFAAEKLILDTLDLGGGYYFLVKGKSPVKSKPILSAIFLEKGKLFTQRAYNASNRKLSALGLYKFVSIRYYRNPSKPNIIDVEINLTPAKKQELGYSLELYTNNSNSLGTGINFNYKNKNLLRGAEIFLLGIESGIEFSFKRDDDGQFSNLINSLELAAKMDLYFPKFSVPFKIQRNLKNKSPKTRLSLSANYTDRLTTFTSALFSSAFGYDWQVGKHIRHVINPAKLDFFLVTKINEDFSNDVLDENTYLKNSINNQFYLGGDYSFSYTGAQRRNGSSWFFKSNVEVAGNTTNFIDELFKPDDKFEPFGNEFSQFLRTDFDLRFYNKLSRRVVFASRIAVSGGFAYGNSTTLPYPKQYFVGGPSSVRAWSLRDLGPGSFILTDATLLAQQPYQQGDLKLEGSMELRFDIFWTLEGAFFLDFGNIWTLNEDVERPGAKISKNFYKQLAVGFGYGIRLDFSYFVVRFDFGYKLRNPYPSVTDGKYGAFEGLGFQHSTFNLGVGYPF